MAREFLENVVIPSAVPPQDVSQLEVSMYAHAFDYDEDSTDENDLEKLYPGIFASYGYAY